MQVALDRRRGCAEIHGAPQIHHLTHGGERRQVQGDVDGRVAVERLVGAAPAAGEGSGEITRSGNRIKTFDTPLVHLQRDRQLDRIQGELGIHPEGHLTADRKIHGKQERHQPRIMMSAR